MPHQPSPFFDPGTHATDNTLSFLQLKRDLLIPTVLSTAPSDDYAEGKVETTRFGIFPHSTLLNQPWGTQVLASKVDTGSRGDKSKKRKRGKEEQGEGASNGQIAKAATATSGFVHLVQPTPETWTLCLPHRTQVVYTPDYSYILQRLRARPGDHIMEAGAGSGSFTHAAARAVFNGYPGVEETSDKTEKNAAEDGTTPPKKKNKRYGKVYSFEFHELRAKQLVSELESHGLGSVVTVTNRDVYSDGFCLPASDSSSPSSPEPSADIIFLDLPAPWLALKHLTRSPLPSSLAESPSATPSIPTTENPQSAETVESNSSTSSPFRTPLNPKTTTRICTFSPCIEQVQKTVSALRAHGWVEISMVEIQARRLEVRRERVGSSDEGVAATVHEAVQRLRDVEGRAKIFHGMQAEKQKELMRRVEKQKRGEAVEPTPGEEADVNGVKEDIEDKDIKDEEDSKIEKKKVKSNIPPSKQDRLLQARALAASRPAFKEGRLTHRTEQEVKTHTSYLVFAVLPQEWTKEDEEKAMRKRK